MKEQRINVKETEQRKTNSRRSMASLYLYLMIIRDSDKENPLTRKVLLDRLQTEYGISMGGHSAGRTLKELADSDLNIFYEPSRGAWYDRHPWW